MTCAATEDRPRVVRATYRRVRSVLTEVGAAARDAAQRAALLDAVTTARWNLRRAAKALGATESVVRRELDRLAPDEYAAARRDGRIDRNRAKE